MTAFATDSLRLASDPDFDAIVVGAGFAGLYSLHKLRDDLGLKVAVFDVAGDVGGTWYWNRYPGARCDIESVHYSYSFSDELQQEWEWSRSTPSQPEILRYLNHVAYRFDLRQDITFNTRVDAAVWDETSARWNVSTDAGITVSARYFISAAGNLSVPKTPEFDGIESFGGEVYTPAMAARGRRPHRQASRRHRYRIQRGPGHQLPSPRRSSTSPCFSAPRCARPRRAMRRPILDRTASIKASYPELRDASRNTHRGVKFERIRCLPHWRCRREERRRVYDDRWPLGGFHIWVTSFSDIVTDKAANDTIADYIRERIRERIQDPDLADKLLPTTTRTASKRPAGESTYYETFNRSNVSLVDVADSPIVSLTSTGLRTTDAGFDFDVIILATGFDAMTGPAAQDGHRRAPRLDARGEVGRRSADLPRPAGQRLPQLVPHHRTAEPVGALQHAVGHRRSHRLHRRRHHVHARERPRHDRADRPGRSGMGRADERDRRGDAAAQDRLVVDGCEHPGKPRVCMIFLAGANVYRQICADVVAGNYQGFALESAKASVG